MNRRTCPNCNEKLGEYDYYFCSACGEKLPEEFVRKPKSIRIKTYKLEDTTKKAIPSFEKLKNKKFIYSTVLIIFIGIVSFGIYSTGVAELIPLLTKQQDVVDVEPPRESEQQQTPVAVNEESNLQSGDFSEVNLASYFPADADFYFDSFDYSLISSNFEDGLTEVFSRSDILFKNSYAGAYFEDLETWVLVFELKDAELVERLLEDVENEEWELSQSDEVLYMMQNEEILLSMEEARDSVVQNLAQNSEFSQLIRNLPTEGAVRTIIMNEEITETLVEEFGDLGSDLQEVLAKVINTGNRTLVVK